MRREARFSYFFFQAEDGIRDATVTGVQTCALPISHTRLCASPEVTDGVAVAPVPLAPQGWEVTDLIAPWADVPWLCDELYLADHRILLDEVEERRQAVHVVELTSERRRQIETESIDVHLDDPVAQRV